MSNDLDPHWLSDPSRYVSKVSPWQRVYYCYKCQQQGQPKDRKSVVLMNRFHEKYDLLLTPTLPVPAFDAGKEFPGPASKGRWTDWTPFSYPFNMTQQPAASIPCGLTNAGLPAGLHIVGPKYGDALVLRAARAYEKTRPIAMPGVADLK